MEYSNIFPSQKKPSNEKGKQWRKDCINGAENLVMFSDDTLRKSKKNKQINYNLYSDILDKDDVSKIIDPLGLDSSYTPAKMQNYPIINPKIDLLVGEEIKRKFDWRVRVINDDAISSKEKQLAEQLSSIIVEFYQKGAVNEEELNKRLEEFQKYKTYEFQDMKEVTGTWILKHLYEKQRMKSKWDKGFKDALLSAEEIYQWDIIAGEPVFIKHNPLNVYTQRSGESPYIEDSEIIVIDSYYPPGKIIDEYHEYLSPNDVTKIEELAKNGTPANNYPDMIIDATELTVKIDTAVFEMGVKEFASPIDLNGNIRVLKVYWKSMRKMKKVKFFDEYGEEQYELMPENYTINKDAGEEEKILWVSEWWEGHKIGGGVTASTDEGIFVKMQPRPIQFRNMENPSLCHPGIVGTVYNTNDNKGMSLMDRMKPYQYMYNSLMYNTELAIATNWGKIMRMPLHEIPAGWEVDKWISYAKYMKIAPVDLFNEGTKGAAMGKLAGAMNQNAPVIDMEMGNTIQLYMNLMAYIKQEVGEIAGVSAQRQGQVSSNELVGNVERAVSQSSHITEYWFAEHADVKRRCLEIGLETAKIAWKNSKNRKLQFVLDDMSTHMVTINGEDLKEIDFDITITDGGLDAVVLQELKSLAHAGIQNDKFNFSQLMDIYTTDSLTSIRRKIEKSESDKIERDQKTQEMQGQLQEQQLKAMADEKQKDRDHDFAKMDKELEKAITIENIKAGIGVFNKGLDADGDGVDDNVELEKQKIANAHETVENQKDRELETKLTLEKIKADLEKAKISSKNKAKA
jgi:hypothetical protein